MRSSYFLTNQLKLENQNPGRSNKDRAAKHMLEGLLNDMGIKRDERGKVLGDKKYTVYEGTSGNTGISLGLLASYMGMSASIVLNNNLSDSKVKT